MHISNPQTGDVLLRLKKFWWDLWVWYSIKIQTKMLYLSVVLECDRRNADDSIVFQFQIRQPVQLLECVFRYLFDMIVF